MLAQPGCSLGRRSDLTMAVENPSSNRKQRLTEGKGMDGWHWGEQSVNVICPGLCSWLCFASTHDPYECLDLLKSTGDREIR